MAIDFGASSSNGWTEEQQKLLSIIPHVTGSLSILGSAFIIYDVASDRKKWSSTYHRLLFAMGIYDFLSSFASSLSTIPMPEDSGILSFRRSDTKENCENFHTNFEKFTKNHHFRLKLIHSKMIERKRKKYSTGQRKTT